MLPPPAPAPLVVEGAQYQRSKARSKQQMQSVLPSLLFVDAVVIDLAPGGNPVRGATFIPCEPPAKDGVAEIVALRRDRGGQRGLFPRQREGPHFAHLCEVGLFRRLVGAPA